MSRIQTDRLQRVAAYCLALRVRQYRPARCSRLTVWFKLAPPHPFFWACPIPKNRAFGLSACRVLCTRPYCQQSARPRLSPVASWAGAGCQGPKVRPISSGFGPGLDSGSGRRPPGLVVTRSRSSWCPGSCFPSPPRRAVLSHSGGPWRTRSASLRAQKGPSDFPGQASDSLLRWP